VIGVWRLGFWIVDWDWRLQIEIGQLAFGLAGF